MFCVSHKIYPHFCPLFKLEVMVKLWHQHHTAFFLKEDYKLTQGFPGGSDDKEPVCSVGDLGSIRVGKLPWRKAWQPTPAFLPGESHRQRSLVGYSPWGPIELDTTNNFTVNLKYISLCRPLIYYLCKQGSLMGVSCRHTSQSTFPKL